MSDFPDRTITFEVWQFTESPAINVMTEDSDDGLDQWILGVSEAKRLYTLLGRAIKIAECGHSYPKED